MDIKRVLTSVLGLPAVIAIILFGNSLVIDIFFAIIALISLKEFFDAFEKGGNAKPIRWVGYIIAMSIAVLRLFHLKSSLVDVDSDMMKLMFALIVCGTFMIFFHILNSGMKKNIVDRFGNYDWRNLYTSVYNVPFNASCIRKWESGILVYFDM